MAPTRSSTPDAPSSSAPGRSGVPSGVGEGGVHRFAVRQLALALATARHAFRGTDETKAAAHAIAVARGEIRKHLARVFGDEGRPGRGLPVRPAAPGRTPAIPERRETFDARLARYLKVRTRVDASAGHRRRQRAGDVVLRIPA